MASTIKAVAQLPPANKDTLAFLILHLQKVAQHSDDNKMPLSNLAIIFGPTIVGHASPNPEVYVMLNDKEKQRKVMMRLLKIDQGYWRQYMSLEQDNPEVLPGPSPNSVPPPRSPSSVLSPSPGQFQSPATPELRPGVYYF